MVTPGPGRRVCLAAALWAAAALVVIARGRADALPSDDAYYYFEIARNAALGLGPGFDSLAPTNGFHPLWAALLVPVFSLLGDAYWPPIRVALGISMLCVAATAWVVQRILAGLGAPRAGELAAFAWLLNPFSAALGLRGMEVALACLLLAVSLAWSTRMARLGRHGPRDFAVLGALLGACGLARTDAALWALALGLPWLAWALRRGGARGLCAGAAGVAAGLLVVSPWLAWSRARTGSLLQSSQQAKQMFDLYGSLDPGPLVWLDALWFPFHHAAGREGPRLLLLLGLAALWAVGVVSAAAGARRRRSGEPTRERLQRVAAALAAPLLLFLALHFGAYLWVFGSYASWYFLPVVLAGCLLQGIATVGVESLPPRHYARLVGAALAALLGLTLFFAAPLAREPDPERRRALGALARSLPPGTRIGLWNAGEVGYFFSHHAPAVHVVNLDGVVNNELVRLERRGRYEEYVLAHVDLLIESPQPYLGQILGTERADRFVRRHLRSGGRRGGWPVLEVVR